MALDDSSSNFVIWGCYLSAIAPSQRALATVKMALFNDPFFRDPIYSSLRNFSGDWSKLFDAPLSMFMRDTQAVAGTPVDVKETPENFHFIAEMPGVKRDQVKVQLEDGNVLCIRGQRTKEELKDTIVCHRAERSSGNYLRRFRLPQNVDVDKISASCGDGVLDVAIPKVAPPQPKKIEVQMK